MRERHKVERKVVLDDEMQKLLSLSQAAKRLGVSAEAVRQLVFRGTLVHVRKDRRNWVPESAIRAMLKDRKWRAQHSRRSSRVTAH